MLGWASDQAGIGTVPNPEEALKVDPRSSGIGADRSSPETRMARSAQYPSLVWRIFWP